MQGRKKKKRTARKYIKIRILLSIEGGEKEKGKINSKKNTRLSSPLLSSTLLSSPRIAKGRILSHATPPSLTGSNQKLSRNPFPSIFSLEEEDIQPLRREERAGYTHIYIYTHAFLGDGTAARLTVVHFLSISPSPPFLFPFTVPWESSRKLVQNRCADHDSRRRGGRFVSFRFVFSLHPCARGGRRGGPTWGQRWKNDVQSWLGSRIRRERTNRSPSKASSKSSRKFPLFKFDDNGFRNPFGFERACEERVPAWREGRRGERIRGGEARRRKHTRSTAITANCLSNWPTFASSSSSSRRGEADVFRVSTRLYLWSGGGGGGGGSWKIHKRGLRGENSSNFNHFEIWKRVYQKYRISLPLFLSAFSYFLIFSLPPLSNSLPLIITINLLSASSRARISALKARPPYAVSFKPIRSTETHFPSNPS